MNRQQGINKHFLASGVVLMTAVAGTFVSAEPVKIVVPNGAATVEGDRSIAVSNFGPFRQQQLYLTSEFTELPATHRTVTGLYARPDYTVVSHSSATYEDLTIKATITPHNELSSVFANNYGGAQVTTVFDGALTMSTQATGPAEGPRGFDYYFPFETPYVYDPADGNLLVEMISTSGPVGSLISDGFNSTSAVYVGAGGMNTLSGNLQNGGFVNQLEFVPEPGSGRMAALLGIAAVVWTRRRR